MTKEAKETLSLLLLSLAVTIFILFDHELDKPSSYIEKVVLPGETLWSIATEIDPVQTGKLVFEIEKINKCTSEIRPGDVILIPVDETY